MLCEIGAQYGFLVTWLTMTILALLSVVTISSLVFVPYYGRPSYGRWTRKCNPDFPSPASVKREIVQTVKGLVVATLIPAFTLHASGRGRLKGYCGDPYSVGPAGHLWQTAIVVGFTDLVEYLYHLAGHGCSIGWAVHRHHHKFSNPSPFAVIADEWPDQFVRTLPMLALPSLISVNMDLLFFCFAALFYGYGVYLHSGYETSYLSAHHPVLNSSYHHYYHHAVSTKDRPVYTGFFVKLWDQLFGTEARDCRCFECRPPSERSMTKWKEVHKPDYSVLLSPRWWWTKSSNVRAD